MAATGPCAAPLGRRVLKHQEFSHHSALKYVHTPLSTSPAQLQPSCHSLPHPAASLNLQPLFFRPWPTRPGKPQSSLGPFWKQKTLSFIFLKPAIPPHRVPAKFPTLPQLCCYLPDATWGEIKPSSASLFAFLCIRTSTLGRPPPKPVKLRHPPRQLLEPRHQRKGPLLCCRAQPHSSLSLVRPHPPSAALCLSTTDPRPQRRGIVALSRNQVLERLLAGP